MRIAIVVLAFFYYLFSVGCGVKGDPIPYIDAYPPEKAVSSEKTETPPTTPAVKKGKGP